MIYEDHSLPTTKTDDGRDKEQRNVPVSPSLARCIKAIWLDLLPATLEAIKAMPPKERR